ncbi:MAG TPA: thioredoxin-like domain-containing protein [Pyrinomonadaceae bacterium]|jgi:thiol-disulfide isomerase/thioredoxin|nr:thioredoxin-like domain-containing protein [Pyrinomonadaceae bacterium]
MPPQRGTIRAPELTGARGWLNTDRPLTLSALKGKVVLLDFWTYGCINCMHIIPDLKRLEKKYPNELVVIGVHSAKFENEKDTENIRRIILRYEIEHPIVNDADFNIWNAYAVNAWPTRYLIDPAGYIIGKLSGEGGYDALDKAIGDTIAEFRKRGELNEAPLKLVLEKAKVGDLPLAFPGKVLADEKSDRLFIADSDHNRIVIAKLDGTLVDVVGTGAHGMVSGSFAESSFSRPQGMALDADKLYVADTENHLIRRIDLKARTVETIAGTGVQMSEYGLSGAALKIALSSPWDLQLVGRTLYIAMAGTHQIWKLDLDKMEVSTFAGSGREGRHDGSLDDSWFAQPSGLASDGQNLFVSDAEANIIREINLGATPKVKTLVGGDLFDFGDKDGSGDGVRLQHPLGLARWNDKLLIADTYNHRIKLLDPAAHTVKAFAGLGRPGQADGASPSFYEPGGLTVAKDKLYVADTNNHAIRVVDLNTKETKTLPIKGLQPPATNPTVANNEAGPNAEEIKLPSQKVRAGDSAVTINVELPTGYHLNPTAPQRYVVSLEQGGEKLSTPPINVNKSAKGLTLPLRVPINLGGGGATTARVSFTFVYCREDNTGVCRIKTLQWQAPIEIVSDAGAPTEIKLSAKVE